MAVWREDLHPRDERGRWTYAGAGGFLLDEHDEQEIARYKQVSSVPETVQPDLAAKLNLQRWGEGDLATRINQELHLSTGDLTDADQRKLVAMLDGLTSKSSLPEDLLLYRAYARPGFAAAQFDSMKPDDSFTDKAFVSTVLQPQIPGHLKLASRNTMMILAPKGSHVAAIGKWSGAGVEEMLIARNANFFYLGENKTGTKVFRVLTKKGD